MAELAAHNLLPNEAGRRAHAEIHRRNADEATAILIRALQWYANPKNWREDDWGVDSVIHTPDYGDPGGKARRALQRWAKKVDG